jgi:Family of unknown function (DUF6002)
MASVIADTGSAVTTFAEFEGYLRYALAAAEEARPQGINFTPAFEIPEPSPALAEYFGVASPRFAELGAAHRSRLVLLDLMGNLATRTVKTLASLVIVARAVRHIETTSEPVMILTPSSANKATALRDAVLRAYTSGLADPAMLQILCVVPDAARPKMWSSALDREPEFAVRNPVCVLEPNHPEHVKTIAVQALADCEAELFARHGIRLWHTLDLANYKCADTVRAFAEQVALPQTPGVSRAHAHSVSSAFGLLGYHAGTALLPPMPVPPQYFLVQHMATPDMVLSLHDMSPPGYRFDPVSGLYRQDRDPRYPFTTFDLAENLEPTFYTRQPTTSSAMNEIIGRQGGGGIVVSLHECLGRYGEIRAMLSPAGVRLPTDPRALREWSLVMAMTGVLNAIDRRLLDVDEVVVHGTGSYSVSDYAPIPDHALVPVAGLADLSRAIFGAARSAGLAETAA